MLSIIKVCDLVIAEACVNNVRAGRADFGAKQGTRSAA